MRSETIGLDVGGTKILGVVVDDGGRVLEEVREPTPAHDGREIVRAMSEVVAALRTRHDVDEEPGLPAI